MTGSTALPTIPARFQKAVTRLRALEKDPGFLGVYIFGSVAAGRTTVHSDLDVKVAVSEEGCSGLNHPVIDTCKLDLSFSTLRELERATRNEIEAGDRRPMLAGSLILFDTNDALSRIRSLAESAAPARIPESDYPFVRFQLFHATNKVVRDSLTDAFASRYSIAANLGEVLKIHYRLSGRWWMSSKFVPSDLASWDPVLANLVDDLLEEADLSRAISAWHRIVSHVASPLGDLSLSSMNCACPLCTARVRLLTAE